MSSLAHFSHSWLRSGPKLAKAQGSAMATLSKSPEKSKRARRSENVEGDIFVGEYATQPSCALKLTHWSNPLLRYIQFCGLWNSLWVSGGTLKNFFEPNLVLSKMMIVPSDFTQILWMDCCSFFFQVHPKLRNINPLNATPSLLYWNPRERMFQFKSHSLLSHFPPKNHGF